ncbi:MAG: ABC transporter permease [Planctomycetales bacterium]|nr:ABC transporter permease [Planctomycetales bacterium]MCA9166518.1 ABC transporter permease [Planctomycetales bacterium]
MLRPYLTVFKDSFHEAFASRVLWILLAVSTLILAAFAPLRLQVTQATDLQLHSVRNWPQLLRAIQEAASSDNDPARKRIWNKSNEDLQKRIIDATQPVPTEPMHRLLPRILRDLNALLEQRDLYDEEAWRGTILNGEATELLKQGIDQLSQAEVKRLNRHLLVAAFPVELAGLPDEQVHLLYAGYVLGGALPITATMAEPAINGIVAKGMDFFVGTIAVFVAILVTAPMIPNTFEAGAVDLLLSKPVNRIALFLVKYLGGCAFILLNTTYFVVGVYLIVGWRFHIWNQAILWCIPVFLFLFGIYYAVSAWAGVIWRNTTVSIVVTILFWASCFVVESVKLLVDRLYIEPARIVALAPTDDRLMALNLAGDLVNWSDDHWEVGRVSDWHGGPFKRAPQVITLTYDPVNDKVLYLEKQRRRGPMSVLGPSITLVRVGRNSGVWAKEETPAPPRGATGICRSPSGDVLIAAADGIFQVNNSSKTNKPTDLSIFGVTLLSGKSEFYTPIETSQDGSTKGDVLCAVIDAQNGDLVVLRQHLVTRLRRDEAGKYVVHAQLELPFAAQDSSAVDDEPVDDDSPSSNVPLLAASGENIWVCEPDGQIVQHVNGQWQPDKNASLKEVRTLLAVNDHLALLTAAGELRVQTRQGDVRFVRSEVTAIATSTDNTLLVGEDEWRVSEYDVASGKLLSQLAPKRDLLHALYDFALVPFYQVFPKPGRLGMVIDSLLNQNSSITAGPDEPLELASAELWRPVWTSGIFTLAVLAATSLYLARADI